MQCHTISISKRIFHSLYVSLCVCLFIIYPSVLGFGKHNKMTTIDGVHLISYIYFFVYVSLELAIIQRKRHAVSAIERDREKEITLINFVSKYTFSFEGFWFIRRHFKSNIVQIVTWKLPDNSICCCCNKNSYRIYWTSIKYRISIFSPPLT